MARLGRGINRGGCVPEPGKRPANFWYGELGARKVARLAVGGVGWVGVEARGVGHIRVGGRGE